MMRFDKYEWTAISIMASLFILVGFIQGWSVSLVHGKPIWPRDNCFSGWFTSVAVVVDGWFAEWMGQQ